MIKLANIAQDLIIENILLQEVGEGVEPYEIRVTQNGPHLYTAEFDILSKEGAILDTIEVTGFIEKEIPKPSNLVKVTECNLDQTTTLNIGFLSNKGILDTINKHQVYKTLSTVKHFITDTILKKRPDIEAVRFGTSGEDKGSAQRMKIYNIYLAKEVNKNSSNFTQPSQAIKDFFGIKVQAISKKINRCLSSFIKPDGSLDLSNKDLQNLDLQYVNFKGANLTNVDFSGANLNNAFFTGADLIDANLQNAKNLNGAFFYNTTFKDTDLSNLNFRYGKLSYAQFPNANLERTDFTGADLRGAKFKEAHNVHKAIGLDKSLYDNHTTWPKGFNIENYK